MIDTKNLKPEFQRLYKESETAGESIERFIDLVSVLRRLCPWDKEQTHESIRRGMIEEAYEVVEAINNRDFPNLREELGDVLLQVVFHAGITEEEGRFDFKDIVNEECEKMIRRHPHVFSDGEAKTVDKVLEKWENIKSKEHGNIAHTERVRDVPKALPALMRSEKVQKRAADAGFDWDDLAGPIAKISEELQEFCEARNQGDFSCMKEELGDLLFSVVNLARMAKIDPEESLNNATEKFIDRFAMLEMRANSLGKRLDDMSLDEMDALWNQIKTHRAEIKEDLR